MYQLQHFIELAASSLKPEIRLQMSVKITLVLDWVISSMVLEAGVGVNNQM